MPTEQEIKDKITEIERKLITINGDKLRPLQEALDNLNRIQMRDGIKPDDIATGAELDDTRRQAIFDRMKTLADAVTP